MSKVCDELEMGGSLPESPRLTFARIDLEQQIKVHTDAKAAARLAQKGLRVMKESYKEALWEEIAARLRDHGAYFCRMKNHVVVMPVRTLYVEIEKIRSSMISSEYWYDILPICEDCQAGLKCWPTEKREDGWYYKKDVWNRAESSVRLLLFPEDQLLEKMAIKAGLKPSLDLYSYPRY
jgi:hypothetical protein